MERQAWKRKGGLDRVVLEHARALLLVLAALVDRAAGLPTLERLHFLAVMGPGEAEARRLIVAMASEHMHHTSAEAAPRSATGPYSGTPVLAAGDVALLAARFRMLALAVEAMLAQTDPQSPQRHAPAVLPPDHNPRRTSQFTPSPALRATSPPASRPRRLSRRLYANGAHAPVAIGAAASAARRNQPYQGPCLTSTPSPTFVANASGSCPL